MKQKLLTSLTAIFISVLLFTGCSTKHHEWVNTETATGWAQELVQQLEARDYEAIVNKLAFDGGTVEDWEAAIDPVMAEYGAIESFGSATLKSNSENGLEYVVVYQQVKHENGTAIYTLSFCEDGSIAGLYVK